MEIFFIFYGLIEATNSIYVYKKKNKYNLYVTLIWGIAFVLVGLTEILHLPQPLNIINYSLFGTTWFPMMFTPCGVKIFLIDFPFTYKTKTIFIVKGSLVRKIIFFIIGIYQYIFLFF